MYKVTWEIPNIPEQTGQGGLGSLCLDVDTPVALSPSRGGGELASGPTRPVHGAGETLPNRMPRHAPPWSSLCPALPWVEHHMGTGTQGWRDMCPDWLKLPGAFRKMFPGHGTGGDR